MVSIHPFGATDFKLTLGQLGIGAVRPALFTNFMQPRGVYRQPKKTILLGDQHGRQSIVQEVIIGERVVRAVQPEMHCELDTGG